MAKVNLAGLIPSGVQISTSREEDAGTQAQLSFESVNALAEFFRAAANSGAVFLPGRPRAVPPDLSVPLIAFVDIARQKEILEYCPEDQVVSVEAGMPISTLQEALRARKQWWPVDVVDQNLSVSDVINSGEAGCLEHGFGGPRDLVLGLSVALSSGEVIKCGGKVVKNVTGYDIQKLFIGAHGSLGIVCHAHLRLFALPETDITLLWKAEEIGQLTAAATALLRLGLPLSTLELVKGDLVKRLCPQDELKDLSGAALIIKLQGQETVAAELAEKAGSKMGSLGSPVALTTRTAERLWQNLADPLASLSTGTIAGVGGDSASPAAPEAAQSITRIEVSVPLTLMAPLLQSQEVAALSPLWQARPGRGRLKLLVARQELQPLIEAIRRFAIARGEALVVAYSDNRWETFVARLPEEDGGAKALKQLIKSKFDPGSCMNPWVSL